MIKFFRRIRRKLLEDRNFSRYLLYAIGEIVLVVIGILIALQINTWNEARKSRKTEMLYISRLIAENQQDILMLDEQIAFAQKGIESLQMLSQVLTDPASADSSVIETMMEYNRFGAIAPVFSSSRSTFDDMSSTGNLAVVRDEQIRNRLVRHYAEIDISKERLQVNVDWMLILDGPFQFQNRTMEFEAGARHLFPSRVAGERVAEIRLNKMDYLQNAAVHHWVNEDAINEFSRIQKQTRDLIRLLEDYLAEH